MPEVLVVNASPLVFLGNAGRLELLQSLGAGRILVPDVVRREVTESSHQDRACDALAAAGWIESVGTVEIPTSVLRWDLDEGESQVIATGLAHSAARLIIDDLAGRRCAVAHGLDVVGTLGVVAAAHKRGLVANPEAVFDELRNAGMWLSNKVLAQASALLKRE